MTKPLGMGYVGVEEVASGEIDYTAAPAGGAGTVDIVQLPAGALITKVVVEVTAGFNAGTTNTLTVGTNASVDDLVGAAVVTAGTPGFYDGTGKVRTAAATTVKAKYAQAGAGATAGKATVYVFFVIL